MGVNETNVRVFQIHLLLLVVLRSRLTVGFCGWSHRWKLGNCNKFIAYDHEGSCRRLDDDLWWCGYKFWSYLLVWVYFIQKYLINNDFFFLRASLIFSFTASAKEVEKSSKTPVEYCFDCRWAVCRTSWPGTFAQKRENEGRRSNGLLSVTQKSVAQVENHPWWCLPSPCHHSSPGFSSHYWICRLLSDSVTQLCPHPARPRHSQAGNPAGNPGQGAALTQSCSPEPLRRFSGSCLQQNQWSSSISSNFCSHWLLQMVVLSQYKLSRCLNAHSLFFLGFIFVSSFCF